VPAGELAVTVRNLETGEIRAEQAGFQTELRSG
jgi:hypothetical protein